MSSSGTVTASNSAPAGSTSSVADNQLRQREVSAAITQLAQNTFRGDDGRVVSFLGKYELSTLHAARSPIAGEIRALANAQPPLSVEQIRTRASQLINNFRSQFPIPAPAAPRTPIAAPTNGFTHLQNQQRRSAFNSVNAQLGHNAFPGPDGKPVNLFHKGFKLPDLAARREPFQARMRSLLERQPPLNAEQIRTEGEKIVAQFRATVGGPPVAGTATATGESGEAARRAAMERGLSELRAMNVVQFEGESYDMTDWIGERAPFETKMQGLLDQTPPLTPEQITAEAAKIKQEWTETGAVLHIAVGMFLSRFIFQMLVPQISRAGRGLFDL